jgi:hypothetical protein
MEDGLGLRRTRRMHSTETLVHQEKANKDLRYKKSIESK